MKMMSKVAILAFALTLAGLGFSPRAHAVEQAIAPDPAVVNDVIRVASTIYVDGKVLATPVVELIPGVVGQVTVSTAEQGPLTILFGTTAVLRTKDGVPYVNLEVSTAKTRDGDQTQLNSTSIGLALEQEGSVEVANADESRFRISVVATRRPLLLDEIAKARTCIEVASSSAEMTGGGCCSVGCPNSPEVTLTCCDVISCCDGVCGACCSP